MKTVNNIIRFLVGGLFIFSGLIKVNDPVGTSIKLKEYFEVFSYDVPALAGLFHGMMEMALPLAVFMVVLEVALGIAVLVNFRMQITMWILLLMIIFFTFLTGYSHFLDRVTDCGCFGDAIPLTPKTSFIKDIILTLLIVPLFVQRHKFLPGYGSNLAGILTGVATLVSLFISISAIRHLPHLDFRAYKIGANIPESMVNNVTPIYEYTFTKNGEEVKSKTYLSADEGYEYVSYEVLNAKEVDELPPITDYNLRTPDGQTDYTEDSFVGTKLMMISHDLNKANPKGLTGFMEVVKANENLGIMPMMVTATSNDVAEDYRHEYQLSVPYYIIDATVAKTIVRANPGLVLIKDGTILGKWHYNDFDEAKEDLADLLK